MDKVKAIKVLKPLVDSYVDYANITMKEEDDDIVDALEMAIEALKALDVPDMNVGDMISRQMAIDALFELYEYQRYIDPTEAADRVRQGVYLAEKKIEQLPSVHSERAEGEWIPFDVEYECSHCGIILQFNEGTPKDNNANFCPNCGADMRGGEND